MLFLLLGMTASLHTELLGLNHNSWDAAYASEEFRNWLFAQQRR